MTTTRPFRFGVVAAAARSADEWADKARRIEALGYATLGVPDGLRFTFAPLPAVAMAAAATRTLRVGPYVLANDYRNPVLLAKEVGTLDFLSGGRFELGIGAGRPAGTRVRRKKGRNIDLTLGFAWCGLRSVPRARDDRYPGTCRIPSPWTGNRE